MTAFRAGGFIGRYELRHLLGEGGMGQVWQARLTGPEGFERLVAIKTVHPERLRDHGFRQRFFDEARLAALIRHDHVVSVLDVGEHEGTPYMVMDYVDADQVTRLADLRRQGRSVPLGVVLQVTRDAATGLHAAHQLVGKGGASLGLVHRDVSPQNLLVIRDSGLTKVIDFGIAKARELSSEETAAGVIKGKVEYMSPEHASALTLDRRADVWALGAVLFELLAGRVPHQRERAEHTLLAVTSGAPPHRLPTEVPADIRNVVMKAIAYRPGDRFETARAFALALEHAAVNAGIGLGATLVAEFMAGLNADAASDEPSATALALERPRELIDYHATDSATVTRLPTPRAFTADVDRAPSTTCSTLSAVSPKCGNALDAPSTPADDRTTACLPLEERGRVLAGLHADHDPDSVPCLQVNAATRVSSDSSPKGERAGTRRKVAGGPMVTGTGVAALLAVVAVATFAPRADRAPLGPVRTTANGHALRCGKTSHLILLAPRDDSEPSARSAASGLLSESAARERPSAPRAASTAAFGQAAPPGNPILL